MSYKLQFFIDEALQCLVDKCQIPYQIIWGEAVVRPYLVESSYFKTLAPLKGYQFYIIFYTKNTFSNRGYMKENFKNNEAYQNF